MGGGDKGGLVLAGREPDAGVEHSAMEASEGGGVGGCGVGEAGDLLAGEEPGKHGADAVGGQGDAGLAGDGSDALRDACGGGFEAVVDGFLVLDEMAEGGDAGGHGEGIAAEGSGLVDGAERGEILHDVGSSAEGSAGQTAADDLAEGGEVGLDGVDLLGATEGETEAGHDLVEDQESAVLGGEVAEALEVARVGGDGSGVADDWLHDDAGDLLGQRLEGFADGFKIVIGQGQGMHGGLSGHACGAGDTEGGDAAAGFDQHGVGVAVVAALELDDEVSAGKSAGEPDGGHACLGAGADEAQLFDGGKAAGDQFGEVGFGGDGGSEARATGGRLLDGLDHGREGVAEDHGPPGAEEVEVAVAVDVVEVGSFGVADERRVTADGAEGPDGRVDASGKKQFGTKLQVARVSEVAGHGLSI